MVFKKFHKTKNESFESGSFFTFFKKKANIKLFTSFGKTVNMTIL